MSDRTSAGIFGDIFAYLAKQPQTPERDAFALAMWNNTREYDFSSYQMEVDEQLIQLGLARMGVDPDYPDERDRVLYKNENGF